MKKMFFLVDKIKGETYWAETEEGIVEKAIEVRNSYEDEGYDVEATLHATLKDTYIVYEL